MRNRRIDMNTAKTTFPAHQPNDVRVNTAHQYATSSVLRRPINAELTAQAASVNAPPPLNN